MSYYKVHIRGLELYWKLKVLKEKCSISCILMHHSHMSKRQAYLETLPKLHTWAPVLKYGIFHTLNNYIRGIYQILDMKCVLENFFTCPNNTSSSIHSVIYVLSYILHMELQSFLLKC